MDRGAWRAAVHGAAKSRTRLGDLARTVSTHAVLQWYLGEGRKVVKENVCLVLCEMDANNGKAFSFYSLQ